MDSSEADERMTQALQAAEERLQALQGLQGESLCARSLHEEEAALAAALADLRCADAQSLTSSCEALDAAGAAAMAAAMTGVAARRGQRPADGSDSGVECGGVGGGGGGVGGGGGGGGGRCRGTSGSASCDSSLLSCWLSAEADEEERASLGAVLGAAVTASAAAVAALPGGVGRLRRSASASREPTPVRTPSLRRSSRPSPASGGSAAPAPVAANNSAGSRVTTRRTRILREICVQTALTGRDVAAALRAQRLRTSRSSRPSQPHSQQQALQADGESGSEDTTARLHALSLAHTRLQADCERQRRQLQGLERRLGCEAAEKNRLRQRLRRSRRRVLTMLGLPPSPSKTSRGDAAVPTAPTATPGDGAVSGGDPLDGVGDGAGSDTSADETDNLHELEIHFQKSGRVVIKQQHEINDLQSLCQSLQKDLEKSLAAQKTLLQQQQETEAEAEELQEFLQAEKSTLADALKDAETEVGSVRQELAQREQELLRQQEECMHLVRISERRRQENLALQARLSGLQARSRELLLQQGAAVSGAAVALSGLSARLDALVEQLASAYSIADKDLEDVIFHNEAYAMSSSGSSGGSSRGPSPESTPSRALPNHAPIPTSLPPPVSTQGSSAPQLAQPTSAQSPVPARRQRSSFVGALLAAIRGASSSSLKVEPSPPSPSALHSGDTSEDTYTEMSAPAAGDLIEAERDPCMESDLDEDTTTCDAGPCSTSSSVDTPSAGDHLVGSRSLHSLSQAILVRQQSEMGSSLEGDSAACMLDDGSLTLGEGCSAASLVDQIIDVDNLVTRLLKVLRIIQLENETCIEELHDERAQLAVQVRVEQEGHRSAQEQLSSWERLGARLKGELEEARSQLQGKVQELENARAQVEAYKKQMECLGVASSSLGALCHAAEQQLQLRGAEAEAALQLWQKSGQLPSTETVQRLLAARSEIPVIQERLLEQELQLAEVSHLSTASKQMLTESWHHAMSEVRRQYNAIDKALETLQTIQGVVLQCPPLAQMQQQLEESNFMSLSALPLVEADLNANATHAEASSASSNGHVTPHRNSIHSSL